MENSATAVEVNVSILYEVGLWTCSALFVASVPCVLAARARWLRQMPWWAVCVSSALAGWLYLNVYAFVEYLRNSAYTEEYNRENGPYALIDYMVAVPQPFALHWGWTGGLIYLGICLGLYGMIRRYSTSGVSRALRSLLIAAGLLTAFLYLPPWNERLQFPAFDFVVAWLCFLVGAGLSYHVLRVLRWNEVGYAFAAMFLVDFLITSAIRGLLQSGQIVWSGVVAWSAMHGAVFTVMWWMGIRGSVPVSPRDVRARRSC